jgi:hypothetical protein
LPDIAGYNLCQVRGFLEATAREEAARDARRLSLLAIGTRGDARQVDCMLDRLTEQAARR